MPSSSTGARALSRPSGLPGAISPPARPATRALVALCVLNHTAFGGSRIAVSLVALAAGQPALAIGLLLAVYALAPALLSVAFGRWIDRAGTRRPALLGVALALPGLVAVALHPAPALLWISAALVGGGYALSALAMQAQLGRCADPVQRATGFGRFAVGSAVSSGLGPFLAGQALAHGGARWAFALLALVCLAALAGVLAGQGGLDDRPSPASLRRADGAPRPRLWHDPALRRVLVADLLLGIAWNGNAFAVPTFGALRHWSPADVGNLMATFGAGVFLARALPPAWRARVGDWPTIRIALAVSGGGFALLACASALPAAFATEALLGLGLGGSLPSVLALLHDELPAGRGGEALGVRQTMLNACAVALPSALGALGALAGLAGVLGVVGGALAAGAAVVRPSARSASSRRPRFPAGRRPRGGARRSRRRRRPATG